MLGRPRRNDVSHSRVARSVSPFDAGKLPSRVLRGERVCALHNKVTDSYHAEYIICIRRTARFSQPAKRKYQYTRCIGCEYIAHVRDIKRFELIYTGIVRT